MDGANVEIVEEVGADRAFIFGMSSDEVIRYENNGGYNPMEIFNNDQDIRRVLMQLINGYFSPPVSYTHLDVYKRQVPRKAGWDTHGLPVELEVEKKLGLDGKEQIEQYGLEPFIQECKKSVWKYKGMWEDFSNTVGFWADMDDPYVTYDNNFIESEWWALKQIWDKGLLYKGFKVVPYCPRCGTPLSSHEVAQGYKDVKERSAIARFKVKGEDAYILAWTTTPWTLPSNLALCVNPNEDYVKVKTGDGYTYYLAQALSQTVLGEDFEVLETYKGKDLEFKEYEPLFDCSVPFCEKQHKKAYYVVCDTYEMCIRDRHGAVSMVKNFI